MKQLITYMLAASCALAPLSFFTAGGLTWQAFDTPAHADDDDGGDDDGGGGGGNNGDDDDRPAAWRKTIRGDDRVRPRQKVKPQRQVVLQWARAEILARDITISELDLILQRGYREIARRSLANGRLVVRLRVPRGWSLVRARDEIARITSGSQVDFNHYYRPRQEASCSGNACAPLVTVGWQQTLSQCSGLPPIGIIDSHVDGNHPVLQGAKLETLEIVEKDLKPARDGHGTAVVALIAGATASDSPGLLPRADVIAINVFHAGPGNDIRTDAFSLISAVEEMRRRNVRIVNMSLSGPANEALEKAIAEAWAGGMFLAAATGNDGPRAKPLYPAAYDGVVAVTAVDDRRKVYRRAGQGQHVDLAAPGVKIRSAGPKGKVTAHTGSSFAVPFVAAAAALHMLNSNMDAASVASLLNSTAVDLGTKGHDPVYGAGLVQLPADCK